VALWFSYDRAGHRKPIKYLLFDNHALNLIN